jgi:hypothetical protein
MYEKIITKLDDDNFFLIMFKIKISGGIYKNISTIQKLNKNEFFKLIEIFTEY